MQTPHNAFKESLAAGHRQLGFWLALGDSVSAEICAGAGFDWLLVDGEHAPHDQRSILTQLQAIAAYPGCSAVVRVPSSDTVVIKQYLDLGAQTILVPMIDTAEEAATAVRASRYPPDGVRGIGGARSAGWGRYARYVQEANRQICVIVQIETSEALTNLERIAEVDGVDGLFVGAADLSASLGFPGNAKDPTVRATISEALRRIDAAGKPSGMLVLNAQDAHGYLGQGASFLAVGMDSVVLAKETSRLAAEFGGYRHRQHRNAARVPVK